MVSILTILRCKRWPLVAAVALLLTPFMVATSYARDVPFNISYTGSLVPIPVDYNNDESFASVLDGQSKGTFGASMTHVVTEWNFTGDMCYGWFGYFELIHAAVVVTFSNGDQLFGAGPGSGWMCMNVNPAGDGYFFGEAFGDFTAGTGRFEGASGSFSSPFTGNNMTGVTIFDYGFGPIQGVMEGMLTLP